MYVTIFVVSLVVAIMFHEFGHYATAKAFGMKVERFFLGFGPTLWSVRRGETEYGVKAIPAGGFVKITGMNRFEAVDEADADRVFFRQAAWKRAIVLSAGSFTHFVVALVVLFAALAFVGLPAASNIVAMVSEDSPAAAAGLQPGDRIVEVDGVPAADFEGVRDLVAERPGQAVGVVVVRDGQRVALDVAIASTDPQGERRGFLGVAPEAVIERMGVGEAAGAVLVGDFSVVRLTGLTVEGLVSALSPSGLSQWFGQIDSDEPRSAEGPISIVGIGQAVSALGQSGDVFAVLAILAQLNIVLGLLNMLPLPPLDGGHLAVLGIEKGVNAVRGARGKARDWALDPAVVTPIALAVILAFTMLTVVAVYLDIVKPASELVR